MTRYFMRDTPLRQMEQQMMTPPHFRPRGYGLYHHGFRYKPKDVECPYCTEYDRILRRGQGVRDACLHQRE